MTRADILSTATSTESVATTSHTINLPSGLEPGDWIGIAFGCDYLTTDPTVFTERGVYQESIVAGRDGFDITLRSYTAYPDYRILGAALIHEVTGNESWFGEASFELQTAQPTLSAAVAFRTRTQGLNASFQAPFDSDDAPAEVSGTPWGHHFGEEPAEILTVGAVVCVEDCTISAYPTGFADDQVTVATSTAGDDIRVAICSAGQDISYNGFEGPEVGAWTLSAAAEHISMCFWAWPEPEWHEYSPEIELNVSIGYRFPQTMPSFLPYRYLDITEWVRRFSFAYGRYHELDTMDAGTGSLLLDNRSGVFDQTADFDALAPFGLSGANGFSIGQIVRFSARINGTVYALWTGAIEAIDYQFPGRVDRTVRVRLVDGFKALSRNGYPLSSRSDLVLQLGPVAYWEFDGDGTEDLSGNGHTLTWSGGPTTGVTGAWTGDVAITLDGSNDYATVADEADLEIGQGDKTVEGWVFLPAPSGSGLNTVFSIRNSFDALATIAFNDDGSDWTVALDPSSTVSLSISSAGGDGAGWHHVASVIRWVSGWTFEVSCYVDGVLKAVLNVLIDSTGAPTWSVEIGRVAGLATGYFGGTLGSLAFYGQALADFEVFTLYNTQFALHPSEPVDDRIQSLLRSNSISTFHMEPAQTTLQPMLRSSTLKDEIDEAVLTEDGVFFYDQWGVATFHDRHYRVLERLTPVAVLGPDDIVFQSVTVSMDDTNQVRSVAITPGFADDLATVPAVPAIHPEGLATTFLPVATYEATTFPQDRNEALSRAQWHYLRYVESKLRLDSVSFLFGPGSAVADLQAVLGARISDKLTVKKSLTQESINLDAFLEAISVEFQPSKEIEVSWQLSPAEPLELWVLGDAALSLLGQSTILGY